MNENRKYIWAPAHRPEAAKVVSHAKATRMLNHAEWEKERRDRSCLEDLNVGEFFTDTDGDRWERTV